MGGAWIVMGGRCYGEGFLAFRIVPGIFENVPALWEKSRDLGMSGSAIVE